MRYDPVAESNVVVGTGNDFLSGDSGANVLNGTRGADRIRGGGGSDRLIAGPGPDTVYAADHERDVVTCGGGGDRAAVDRQDRVRDCERVRVRDGAG